MKKRDSNKLSRSQIIEMLMQMEQEEKEKDLEKLSRSRLIKMLMKQEKKKLKEEEGEKIHIGMLMDQYDEITSMALGEILMRLEQESELEEKKLEEKKRDLEKLSRSQLIEKLMPVVLEKKKRDLEKLSKYKLVETLDIMSFLMMVQNKPYRLE